jgi:hypothetical protein
MYWRSLRRHDGVEGAKYNEFRQKRTALPADAPARPATSRYGLHQGGLAGDRLAALKWCAMWLRRTNMVQRLPRRHHQPLKKQ